MAADANKSNHVSPGIIELLDPTARANPLQREMAERKSQLSGTTLALIDNTKPNAGAFLDRIGELMIERQLGVSLLRVRKQSSTGPAHFLEDLRERCDLAITAFGD